MRALRDNASPRLPQGHHLFARFLRNRGAFGGFVVLAVILACALLADALYPGAALRIVGPAEIRPFETWQFPLGTDSMGRDIAAMIVHGTRSTLAIGLCAALTATVIGVTVGASAAWFGGWTDEILMRCTELFQIIPNIVLILTVVSILGPRIGYITLAVGLVSWPSIARLMRSEFLSLKEREYVLACRALGMGNFRIIIEEIIPNALPPVIVMSSMVVAGAILYESVVSFLGLGDPNVPSWGRLIGEGRSLIRTAPYLCAIPGIAIMLVVLSLNLVGDGLNDALNPKLRDR